MITRIEASALANAELRNLEGVHVFRYALSEDVEESDSAWIFRLQLARSPHSTSECTTSGPNVALLISKLNGQVFRIPNFAASQPYLESFERTGDPFVLAQQLSRKLGPK